MSQQNYHIQTPVIRGAGVVAFSAATGLLFVGFVAWLASRTATDSELFAMIMRAFAVVFVGSAIVPMFVGLGCSMYATIMTHSLRRGIARTSDFQLLSKETAKDAVRLDNVEMHQLPDKDPDEASLALNFIFSGGRAGCVHTWYDAEAPEGPAMVFEFQMVPDAQSWPLHNLKTFVYSVTTPYRVVSTDISDGYNAVIKLKAVAAKEAG